MTRTPFRTATKDDRMQHLAALVVEQPATSGQDEATLVRAAQADSAAFAPLYDRYLPRVYRYLRARVDSEETAADLTQDVFLRALDSLPSYQARGLPFAAWLFRIARNAVTDTHRRRRAHLPLDGIPPAQETTVPDPEAQTLHDDDLRDLGRLLAQLDPARRELLALRFAAGLTAPEIARVTGRSEAAVKKQMSRTLTQLKERYRAAQP
jgi:RNA polymerase sigma-70 factor, ECF subfamily